MPQAPEIAFAVALIAFLGVLVNAYVIYRNAEKRAKTDADIAALAARFGRLNFEHQIRFSKLHEQQLQVIARTYKLLARAIQSAKLFISFDLREVERDYVELGKAATESARILSTYFNENQLFLPRQLQSDLEAFIRELDSCVFAVAVYYDELSASLDSAESEGIDMSEWNQERIAARVKANLEILALGTKLKRSIESQFRQFLLIDGGTGDV